MEKDEVGRGMLLLVVMENIALFMEDCNILFEINKRLVILLLYLFQLQKEVQLCNHLHSAIGREPDKVVCYDIVTLS